MKIACRHIRQQSHDNKFGRADPEGCERKSKDRKVSKETITGSSSYHDQDVQGCIAPMRDNVGRQVSDVFAKRFNQPKA